MLRRGVKGPCKGATAHTPPTPAAAAAHIPKCSKCSTAFFTAVKRSKQNFSLFFLSCLFAFFLLFLQGKLKYLNLKANAEFMNGVSSLKRSSGVSWLTSFKANSSRVVQPSPSAGKAPASVRSTQTDWVGRISYWGSALLGGGQCWSALLVGVERTQVRWSDYWFYTLEQRPISLPLFISLNSLRLRKSTGFKNIISPFKSTSSHFQNEEDIISFSNI